MRWIIALAGLGCLIVAGQAWAQELNLPRGFDPDRHLSVQQVSPGMRGYGLSVFEGTRIEPFPVEVVSIARGQTPGKAVVWIRCPGERMQKTGPVSGMSGSPIFLWTDADRQHRMDGRSGKLLGAFAYGYPLSKDAYVGVQPIEQMLAAGQRAQAQDIDQAGESADPSDSGGRDSAALIKRLAMLAEQRGMAASRRWRLMALGQLIESEHWPRVNEAVHGRPSRAENRDITGPAGQYNALPMPMAVPSVADAQWLAPLLEPLGLMPVAGPRGAAFANLPPPWLDPARVQPVPGGVLSIPLIAGDLDLGGVGTITEVLRDDQGNIDQILAFGHGMMSQGPTRLPMASGFVHFVQPSIQTSFKMGGSLRVIGSLVNDESVAVVGRPGLQPLWRNVAVDVRWPTDSKNRRFEYRIVDHPQYTPILAAYAIVFSLLSDTELPPHASLDLDATLHFAGGRTLEIAAVLPEASAFEVLFTVAPMVGTLIDNPFEPLALEAMESTVRVAPTPRSAQLVNVRVESAKVKPGDTVVVHTQYKPFRGEVQTHRSEIKLPADLPDGQYPVIVGGASSYQELLYRTQPHRMRITDIDGLFEAVSETASVNSDALFTMLVMDSKQGVAVGRTALEQLPGSRAAMLAVPTSTQTTPFVQSIIKQQRLGYVIGDQMVLPVTVQRNPTSP